MKVTFTFNFGPMLCARRSEVRAALGILALGLSGCAVQAAVPPVSSDAQWANERWPGTTVAELAHGRDLFVSRCASCHSLPRPDVKSNDEWVGVLDEMANRAKLSTADRDLVLRYLSATSQRLRAPEHHES